MFNSACVPPRQRGRSVACQFGIDGLIDISLTYNGCDDQGADDTHESIQIPPPSGVLIACLINHTECLFKVMD